MEKKKWYVYRLRYWKKVGSADIMDFLNNADDDDEEEQEGVEWWGSNDPDGYTLYEDRICIQDDHCYGKPTLFLWSHDFCSTNDNATSIPSKYEIMVSLKMWHLMIV